MYKKIKIRNSTELPVKSPVLLEIDTSTNVLELKKHLKDEFDLPNLQFILFHKDQKYVKMNDEDQLEDFKIDEKKIIEIRRPVKLDKLHELQKILSRDEVIYPYGILHVETTSADVSKKRLVEFANRFIHDALNDPSGASFSIPSRSGDNIGFDEETDLVLLGKQRIERQFRSLGSVKSVQQLAVAMKHLHEILDRNIHQTKRDLFYMSVNEFENQNTSDNLIEDIGAMLQVTRPSLNINASAKGAVVGHLQYNEVGDFIDCTKIGASKSISPNIDDITNMQSDAELVLIIEKEAIFSRLAEDRFFDYVPSIIITAKGQPDMATRMFLKKINDELKLPMLAIMDADIYGFEILRVYSVGSKALSFEAANLAVPNIKWMGLLPSDLLPESEFQIPKHTHIKMTKSDERRTKLLLEEEFVRRKPEWRKELEILLNLEVKAEIQALNARDPQFITNHYIPHKLNEGGFI